MKKRARGRDERYIESIIFLTFTPEYAHRNRVANSEERLNDITRFKFAEDLGRSVPELEGSRLSFGNQKCFLCQPKAGTYQRKRGGI